MSERQMFKIESGIELIKNKTGKPKYPLGEMSIGDSFLIEGSNPDAIRNKVSASIVHFRKHNREKKFTTRIVSGGLRIWRTA